MMDLTLSAYRAEPPLGSSLPSVGSLSLGKLSLSRGSWNFLWRRRHLRILIILLHRSRFRIGMGDGTSSTELDHIDRTLAARDQMTARQKDNLTG